MGNEVKHKCKMCKKKVGQVESIACDRCGNWNHRKCTELPKEIYDFISNKVDGSIQWLCTTCKGKDTGSSLEKEMKQLAESINKYISVIERLENIIAKQEESMTKLEKVVEKQQKEINKLKANLNEGNKPLEEQENVRKLEKMVEKQQEEITKLKTNFNVGNKPLEEKYPIIAKQEETTRKLEKVVEKQQEEINKLKTNFNVGNKPLEEKTLDECVKEKVLEIEDKRARKYNLVMLNVPEENETQDQNEDEVKSKRIFQELQIENITDIEVKRLGRVREGAGQKPRPLLVKVSSTEIKWEIIKKSKALRRSENYQNIFINPDQTKKEREASWRLRKELRERKQNETGLYIKQGKICKREGNFYLGQGQIEVNRIEDQQGLNQD